MRMTTAALIAAGLTLAACGGGDGSTRSTTKRAVEDSTTTVAPAGDASTTAPAAKGAKDAAPAPITSRDRLKGTASPNLGEGEVGKVTVVSVGKTDNRGGGTVVPFAVRNRTATAVRAEVSATARDASGTLVASGSALGTHPGAIGPGEIGLGYVYFKTEDPGLPEGTKFEFTVSTKPEQGGSFGLADLKVTEVSQVGKRIVGAAVNDLGERIGGPYGVQVSCFEGDTLISTDIGYATPGSDAEPNATESFSIDLFDHPCPTFLVGVGGFFN